MAEGYAVNIEALGKLIGQLESATARIGEANRKLAGAQAFGLLGNPTLAEEGGRFEETWEYGLAQLGEAAAGVTERLDVAKRKYGELEEEHARLFPQPPPLITEQNRPPAAPAGGPDLDEGPVGGGYTGGLGDLLGGGR
ncbi:hypothetical protein [Amycolatopsis albispora]|uniref:PE domain-containing protein n=1 Tax=Amycolatopsis albispora TaxID=1804986 RepID=A0A344L5K6_9PSEU|nr:hypothetical protein [Amycolatopsis albispora]AXB43330.1 hypothetical protein A4R43_12850 [Amycolatopsis albispora]